MKIIVDGFGGDNAPLQVLQGCSLAAAEYGVDVVITGDEAALHKCATENRVDCSRLQFVDADGVISVEEEPSLILKEKADCSMGVALRMLRDGQGDAVVSAGSTGALTLGATFIVKRIKGVKRAALAPIMPAINGCYMLMDAGANLDCRPEMLLQFGVMGACYMQGIMGIPSPRVALVNIGAEETKGTQREIDAYQLLQKAPIRFTGNIEARDIPLGGADVIVADGFAGNIVLKLSEGWGKFMSRSIKELFHGSPLALMSGTLVLGRLKKLKKEMDYTEYGGAPLMGIAKPVIKAHGSSDANAFKNAVRQAKQCVACGVTEKISQMLNQIKLEEKTQE